MNTVTTFFALFRPAIALFAGAAAATGYLAAAPAPSTHAFIAGAGVFLLACGASAVNQIEERDLDALMERTRYRPLPQGLLTPLQAGGIAVCMLASGAATLLFFKGPWPALFGLLAVIWYTSLYTPVKRFSAFAAVYGAPVGIAAPLIGWIAGGRPATDPRFAVLALLFLLWQITHFWLLLLASGDDLARAGLPTPVRIFSRERFASLTALWMAATAVSSLLLPLFGLVRAPLLYALLVSTALLPAVSAVRLFRSAQPARAASFRMLNGFLAAVLLLIAADAVLSR